LGRDFFGEERRRLAFASLKVFLEVVAIKAKG